MARAANTSANYFSEKFKEATGENFVKYVARIRFDKAAALLCEADMRGERDSFCLRISIAVAIQSGIQKTRGQVAHRISHGG